jgi:hypothetical protein
MQHAARLSPGLSKLGELRRDPEVLIPTLWAVSMNPWQKYKGRVHGPTTRGRGRRKRTSSTLTTGDKVSNISVEQATVEATEGTVQSGNPFALQVKTEQYSRVRSVHGAWGDLT